MKIGCNRMDWFRLSEDRVQWLNAVYMEIIFNFP